MVNSENKESGAPDLTNNAASPADSQAPASAASNPSGDQEAALKAVEIAQKEILYIRAEFENYKKRIAREQEQAIRFANKMLVADLLTLLDLFDRAVSHGQTLKGKNDADINNFINGVEMTRHELTQLMQRNGVEFVGDIGEKFDPEKHEAIAQQDAETGEPDTVVQVLQKGCKLHGKLIKPAKVAVGKKN